MFNWWDCAIWLGGFSRKIAFNLKCLGLNFVIFNFLFERRPAPISINRFQIRIGSPQHSTTIENLPDNVLSNIFVRLYSKQLAQMRPVSKSWNVFLSQSSFIKSHLQHSIHNNDEILLLFFHEYFFSVKPVQLPIRKRIKLPDSASVIGSANGLICLSCGSVIHIWNPSLSNMLTLPPYYMPSSAPNMIIFRFGFDPKTDDYKVVKLSSLLRPGSSNYVVKEWLQVKVFSMRKGSWQSITQKFPSHITRISGEDGVCVDCQNGYVYWLGCIDEKMKLQTIVGFDLVVETFYEIPLPNSMLYYNVSKSYVLGVCGVKLCVMSWLKYGEFEVWVMEEYGVTESWVKVEDPFILELCGNKPFGFILSKKFVYRNVGDGPVMNYRNEAMIRYVDSLVWITPSQPSKYEDGK